MTTVPTQCFELPGTKDGKGYIVMSVNGRSKRAHRYVWELNVGPIPPGMIICHNCDNPSCCNLDHLFLGTHQSNSDDKVAKGRQAFLHGESNGMAVLTVEKVREIHVQLKIIGTRATARMFNVGVTTIHNIKIGRSWTRIWEEFNA